MLEKTKIVLLSAVAFALLIACNQSPEATEEEEIKTPPISEINYTQRGLDFAMSTKAILGKNLIGTVQNEGTEKAVEFCNHRAYPLTDSMAKALHAKIKRVSDLPRNTKNIANEAELAFIAKGKETLTNGQKITPQVQEVGGKMIGYYPILTNSFCLKCHGDSEAIEPATLAKIQALYPDDKATGYFENQLRGIWVVEMDND